MPSRSNVRIGNVSGATGDAPHAMARMARDGNVDVITGDWLSEMNIAWNAIIKTENPNLGYEAGFLHQLEESIDIIVEKNIKVVTNAGALNTLALYDKVAQLCKERGHESTTVAAVIGDDVYAQISRRDKNTTLRHLDSGESLQQAWGQDLVPSCAAAYIGSWGIVKALRAGADIVLCGRVTDASPVIGACAWWHDWNETDYQQLAGGLVAGHLIECGPYATGANFSGFKDYLPELVDLSFPIAEVLSTGACFITKIKDAAGTVNKFNITAQLLYELQGELYINSDVVADLSNIRIDSTEQRNVVSVSGVVGLPPPATTKVMVAALGGFQAEAMYYINGLDIEAKATMMKNQLKNIFKNNKFSKFSVELYGAEASNPSSQAAGTCMLRVFVQARRLEDIAAEKFKIPLYSLRMQSYPGYHMNLDFRIMDPKPFMELFPTTMSIADIRHQVIMNGETMDVAPQSKTGRYATERPSYETRNPTSLDSYGETEHAPLGSVVHARSGDKANNSNVGFFVRHADEYAWLQSIMTIERLKELLGNDWPPANPKARIERCEFPEIWAVHFRILDFLDGGIASSSRIDGLGKGIGEYLRSKYVDVPVRFLQRGRI